MTTLHEKAKKGLKDEILTTELLNEKDARGNTVWHVAAEYKTLKEIPLNLFTVEVLNQKGFANFSVFESAATFDTLKHIPKHLFKVSDPFTLIMYAALGEELKEIPIELFSKEILNRKAESEKTILYVAAEHGTLKGIPEQFLNSEAFAQTNNSKRTVWHEAACSDGIKDIPHHLFSEEALNLEDEDGVTVWELIAKKSQIKNVPLSLINNALLEMKKEERLFDEDELNEDGMLFDSEDSAYIKKVISNRLIELNAFIKTNPELENDIIYRDDRYKLIDVKDNTVCFGFEGIKDKIVLNKAGAFIDNINHKTLNNAVSVIEKAYPNLEQSIFLPKNEKINVNEFSL